MNRTAPAAEVNRMMNNSSEPWTITITYLTHDKADGYTSRTAVDFCDALYEVGTTVMECLNKIREDNPNYIGVQRMTVK